MPRNSRVEHVQVGAGAERVAAAADQHDARPSSSSSARSSAAPSCVSSPQLTQFITSGRFSQIVRDPVGHLVLDELLGGRGAVHLGLQRSCSLLRSVRSRTDFKIIHAADEMASGRWSPRRTSARDRCAILNSVHAYRSPTRSRHPPVRSPHIGSVNAWLLRGRSVTLIDTGPARATERSRRSRPACATQGLRVEDIELVLATHHHLDHVGLAADDRSAARAPPSRCSTAAADYAARYPAEVEADRRSPTRSCATTASRSRWSPTARASGSTSAATTEDFRADRAPGRRRPHRRGRARRCGWSRARATARPTRCSSTTSTGSRSPATTCWRRSPRTPRSARAVERGRPRPRSRVRYLESLQRTAAMPLDPAADRPRRAGDATMRSSSGARLREHRRRCERILAILRRRPAHGVRDRRRTCGRRARSPNSRCSSSGRSSATSSCCWPRASWPSASSQDGSRVRCRADFALSGHRPARPSCQAGGADCRCPTASTPTAIDRLTRRETCST